MQLAGLLERSALLALYNTEHFAEACRGRVTHGACAAAALGALGQSAPHNASLRCESCDDHELTPRRAARDAASQDGGEEGARARAARLRDEPNQPLAKRAAQQLGARRR